MVGDHGRKKPASSSRDDAPKFPHLHIEGKRLQ